jgi:hypothetical protein
MCVRNLREIEKVASGETADKFQRGIWMADQLARYRNSMTISHSSTISSRDFSTYVDDVIRGFER